MIVDDTVRAIAALVSVASIAMSRVRTEGQEQGGAGLGSQLDVCEGH